jgi:hypothetical protein
MERGFQWREMSSQIQHGYDAASQWNGMVGGELISGFGGSLHVRDVNMTSFSWQTVCPLSVLW